ncbi:Hemolysin-type calcium-binding repeat family protein [Sulfitobacter noctilucae]|uniref:calcium-binding protein n=1 Tax=Sulfitobacter noctilucae TaxID=1342302 RepID=UPI000468890E|nr:calcium-binding protein [Sulfitobacter noctilucae]KIN65800.1 Hemolysin-type calcium-binding repeat family protein [Sulfitobacter noctilucae]
MVRATFTNHGGLHSAEEFGLVGLSDIEIIEGAGGPMLFAATRGDGWLTAYDLNESSGNTSLAQNWQLAPNLLQLETTDLVLRDVGGTQQLFMAGLNGGALTGVRLDRDGIGNAIDGGLSYTAPGRNLSNISEMELIGDGSTGLAALRTGGLVNVSFGSGTTINLTNIHQGNAMQGERATDIITTTHNGQTYAFVSYGSEDTVSMFRQNTNGSMQHISDVDATDGFWVDRPGGMTVTSAADGQLYVVVAGSGSDSLTTFAVNPNGMTPVDHLIDTLDTRFRDASHVTNVTLDGQNFVLAAGSDSGVNLFTVLPGGRLQHVDAMAGTADTPLRAITSIDAMATPDGIRFWVATETAPYLSEFSISLPNIGTNLGASSNGSQLYGTVGDDVLSGASGNDRLNGGFGNDILLDGAGQDTMRGDGGLDTFVVVEDGARDTILDFQMGFDRLDLSDFGTVGGLGGMTIVSQSWGAEFRVGSEVLEVRSADGSRFRSTDFDTTNLITGSRIQTDPAEYPGSTAPTRDDPNPGYVDNPTGIDPNSLTPAWQDAPTYALNRGSNDRVGTNGHDHIQSGGQNDRVFGALGNDTIEAGAGRDAVNGEGGNDSIAGGGESDYLLGGAGFDTIHGGDGNDTISGDTFADSITGGDGNDILLGGDGFDQLHGNSGNDRIWAGSSPDRVYGGDGDDWLSAGSNFGFSVDGVFGGAGNDTMFGNAGFDLLMGGDGDDVIDGGHQSDNIYGEEGNDILIGNLGFDRLFGGRGDDRIFGGDSGDGVFGQEGDDTLWGGEGGDRFFGGQGDDVVDGGTGNDTVYGGAGFDTVIGGEGNDMMFGSFNADEFVFSDGHGNDTIGDFDAFNGNEVMDFSRMSGFNQFMDVRNAASQSGQDVVINTGSGNSIRLRNVNLNDLDENDFTF